MGRMNKPEVDYIKEIAPAIDIEQKVIASNPRSTVGTSTEIYDYLKLFFARVGKTWSPVSGKIVKKHTVSDVVDFILQPSKEEQEFTILCPLHPHGKRTLKEELAVLLQKGFRRVRHQERLVKIETLLDDEAVANEPLKSADEVQIVIDRVVIDGKEPADEETVNRLADSVQTAFFEGKGECLVLNGNGEEQHFCDRFELDGMRFEEPTPQFFSFNSPYGACRTCEGYGKRSE